MRRSALTSILGSALLVALAAAAACGDAREDPFAGLRPADAGGGARTGGDATGGPTEGSTLTPTPDAGAPVLERKDPGRSLELGFEPRPAYLGPKEIVLTFDDGPDDDGHTDAVLDILKARGLKAAFFVNTDAGNARVATSTAAQATLRRIVAEGHELGNHTVHHLLYAEAKPDDDPAQHFSLGSEARIVDEIDGVEKTLGAAFGRPTYPLTVFRAPQGYPYSLYFKNDVLKARANKAAYENVARVVRRHAVHVSWNIDSNDWRCATGDDAAKATCILGNIKAELDKGSYGILLMHSIDEKSELALPQVLDELVARGFAVKTLEDAVRGAFQGKSSVELMTMGP